MIGEDFATHVAATARGCASHLEAGGGGAAVVGALRDLANLADQQGRCHACGHWRVDYCNVDGFSYCEQHYPKGLR